MKNDPIEPINNNNKNKNIIEEIIETYNKIKEEEEKAKKAITGWLDIQIQNPDLNNTKKIKVEKIEKTDPLAKTSLKDILKNHFKKTTSKIKNLNPLSKIPLFSSNPIKEALKQILENIPIARNLRKEPAAIPEEPKNEIEKEINKIKLEEINFEKMKENPISIRRAIALIMDNLSKILVEEYKVSEKNLWKLKELIKSINEKGAHKIGGKFYPFSLSSAAQLAIGAICFLFQGDKLKAMTTASEFLKPLVEAITVYYDKNIKELQGKEFLEQKTLDQIFSFEQRIFEELRRFNEILHRILQVRA